MPLRPDDSNSLSDGRGMEPGLSKAWVLWAREACFNSHLAYSALLLLLHHEFFYDAISSWLLSRWRSHVFSINLSYDTALFINAAGFSTRLNSSSQGFCFICLCIYSSGLQRGCLAHGLLNESKRFYPRWQRHHTVKEGAGTMFLFAGRTSTHWSASPQLISGKGRITPKNAQPGILPAPLPCLLSWLLKVGGKWINTVGLG